MVTSEGGPVVEVVLKDGDGGSGGDDGDDGRRWCDGMSSNQRRRHGYFIDRRWQRGKARVFLQTIVCNVFIFVFVAC